MEPMVGLDAKFLYSETPSAHMHTLKVAVFDLSAAPDAYSFDELVRVLGGRLDRLAPFRRRAVPVPLSLGHPVWIEDPEFDLRRHVTRRRVAEPGGERELAAVVADVAGRPLRRDRPLWELVVVEGLAEHRVAVVAKLHHALADGATAVALLQQALDPAPPDAPAWQPEPVPSARQLVGMALRAHRQRARGFGSLARRSVSGLRDAAARRRRAPVRPPMPFEAPRTPFNVSLTPERVFAMTTLPFDQCKAVRDAFGVTLNDVFLAVCSGALRAYLAQRGALPDRPLLASVPVGTAMVGGERAAGVTPRGGNHVDNLYVSIATDVADPAGRVRRIHEVAEGAKRVRAALGNDLLEERAEVVPPQLYELAIRTWTRTRLADHLRPPVNLVLSNVPGPRRPLEVGVAVLESLYSVGPILEGIGCNITAWSYAGNLHVAVLGCPRSLPDPWPLADALHASLAELTEAAAAQPRVQGAAG